MVSLPRASVPKIGTHVHTETWHYQASLGTCCAVFTIGSTVKHGQRLLGSKLWRAAGTLLLFGAQGSKGALLWGRGS